MERERFEIRHAELRMAGDGRKVEGLAIPYGVLSNDLGGFKEIITTGAASGSMKSDVRALYAHDSKLILGRTSSGTLQLREDAEGVHYSLDLPDTQLGRDIRELVKRKDVDGASFRMFVDPGGDRWEKRQGQKVRVVTKMEFDEITLTSIPAYSQTSAALRSMDEWEQGLLRRRLIARLAGL